MNIQNLVGHTSSIYCLAYLKKLGNKYILSGSRDFTIRIWDILDGNCLFNLLGIHQYSILTNVYFDKFSTDNCLSVASGAADNLIKIADIQINYHGEK